MKKLFFLLVIILLNIGSYAQTSVLNFYSDTVMTVYLYRPIKQSFNNMIPTDTLSLVSGRNMKFHIDVDDFSNLFFRYSNGVHGYMLVFPGDSIGVEYANSSISFSGNNCKGMEIINRNMTPCLRENFSHLSEKLFEYVEGKADFPTLRKRMMESGSIEKLKSNIHQLAMNNLITHSFEEVMCEDLTLFDQSYKVHGLRSLLLISEYKAVASKDSVQITNLIDSIFSLFPNADSTFMTRTIRQIHGYNYFTQYFYHYKDRFKCEFLTSAGHPFEFAPDYLRPTLLGISCLGDILYGSHVDETRCRKYLNEYGDIEYATIIQKLFCMSDDVVRDSLTIVENIDEVSALSTIKQLEGKKLLVDIWAPWCVPCRKEFQYKSDLENLVSNYPSMEIVYISLESPDKAWHDLIERYSLHGIHIIANEKLKESLKKEIFSTHEEGVFMPHTVEISNGKMTGYSITIPRYFLLDKDGKVLLKELPRPSSLDKLKAVLDSIFD